MARSTEQKGTHLASYLLASSVYCINQIQQDFASVLSDLQYLDMNKSHVH